MWLKNWVTGINKKNVSGGGIFVPHFDFCIFSFTAKAHKNLILKHKKNLRRWKIYPLSFFEVAYFIFFWRCLLQCFILPLESVIFLLAIHRTIAKLLIGSDMVVLRKRSWQLVFICFILGNNLTLKMSL